MSKKKDPIVSVIAYFEAVSLEVAQMALALVKAAVQRRIPAVQKAKRTRGPNKPKAYGAAEQAQAQAIQATPVLRPLPPSTALPLGEPTRRRRQRAVPLPAAQPIGEVDGLPGLGPATVGD